MVSLIAAGLCVIYALFYAWIGFQRLLPIIVLTIIGGILWAATIPMMRFGQAVAVSYNAIVTAAVFVMTGWLAGSAPGNHYHLLAAPMLMLTLGIRRWKLALLLMFVLVAAFLVVEIGLPRVSQISPFPPEVAAIIKPIAVLDAALMSFGGILYALLIASRAEAALEREYARSEHLLENLMPASIAARLKENPEEIIADHYDSVAILFADIVDFTPRASRLPPAEVVGFLNRVFKEFDRLAAKHGLEKIKTIGDAYMVAGGLPDRLDGHEHAVAEMALDMLEATRQLSTETGEEIAVRIGIHVGPAIAGVIGTRKLFYDVWGDTVNTASRMESMGSAGTIQVTQAAVEALSDSYSFEHRGSAAVKGKGEMELYRLTARKKSILN